jgi:hypothetical protein
MRLKIFSAKNGDFNSLKWEKLTYLMRDLFA